MKIQHKEIVIVDTKMDKIGIEKDIVTDVKENVKKENTITKFGFYY